MLKQYFRSKHSCMGCKHLRGQLDDGYSCKIKFCEWDNDSQENDGDLYEFDSYSEMIHNLCSVGLKCEEIKDGAEWLCQAMQKKQIK